jgi:hypothetical protein
MDVTDGKSGCRSIEPLELIPCEERDGTIIVPLPGVAAADEADQHAASIQHFLDAAYRFRSLQRLLRHRPKPHDFEEQRRTRNAAIFVLLGLPGAVVRARLEAPVSRLLTAILDSGVRRLPRTAEEEATFIECWRRLGKARDDDTWFSCGIAVLALSNHGYELVALQPLDQKLGWAEQFWLRCLMETLPGFVRPGDSDRLADSLPPPLIQIQKRLAAMAPGARAELIKPSSAAGIDAQTVLDEEIRTLTGFLKEANADRELCHQQITTLTNFLKEANADREVSHRHIEELASSLKEANADREVSHRHIEELASSLKEANADRAVCHARIAALMAEREESKSGGARHGANRGVKTRRHGLRSGIRRLLARASGR